MAEGFSYEGADLESMDMADNYHRWVLGFFEPHLGRRVVEVGAGLGSFSRLLAMCERPEQLFLIEPSAEMAGLLSANAEAIEIEARAFHGFLIEAEMKVREFGPESFIYVNVLEHLEDDVGELTRAFGLLPSGGTLCAFVPALPRLYSNFDRSIDHFRRYTAPEMCAKAAEAGFEVEVLRYFDLFGILPWLVKFRILGSTKLSPRAVAAYDRFVVPLASRLERWIQPPIGKNLLMVARKP